MACHLVGPVHADDSRRADRLVLRNLDGVSLQILVEPLSPGPDVAGLPPVRKRGFGVGRWWAKTAAQHSAIAGLPEAPSQKGGAIPGAVPCSIPGRNLLMKVISLP